MASTTRKFCSEGGMAMASVNKVILVGNLGADPELRQLASGDAVCTLSVATSERYKDRAGEQQTNTQWHRVVLYRRLAEIANQYLRKGSAAYFEGRLTTRKWTDKSGVERTTTEIEAHELTLLDRAEAPRPVVKPVAYGAATVAKPELESAWDDDVPF